MNSTSILLPCLGMVALTAAVWVRMYVERLGEMRARRIPAEAVSTSRQAAEKLQKVNAADNFRNLFEVPVLFYAFCLTTLASQAVTPGFVMAAWLYVVLRTAHSAIHCSYNNVIHRFVVYSVSTLLLFGMWAALAVQWWSKT